MPEPIQPNKAATQPWLMSLQMEPIKSALTSLSQLPVMKKKKYSDQLDIITQAFSDLEKINNLAPKDRYQRNPDGSIKIDPTTQKVQFVSEIDDNLYLPLIKKIHEAAKKIAESSEKSFAPNSPNYGFIQLMLQQTDKLTIAITQTKLDLERQALRIFLANNYSSSLLNNIGPPKSEWISNVDLLTLDMMLRNVKLPFIKNEVAANLISELSNQLRQLENLNKQVSNEIPFVSFKKNAMVFPDYLDPPIISNITNVIRQQANALQDIIVDDAASKEHLETIKTIAFEISSKHLLKLGEFEIDFLQDYYRKVKNDPSLIDVMNVEEKLESKMQPIEHAISQDPPPKQVVTNERTPWMLKEDLDKIEKYVIGKGWEPGVEVDTNTIKFNKPNDDLEFVINKVTHTLSTTTFTPPEENYELFKTMLEAYKESHPGKNPKITTDKSSMDVWEKVVADVYQIGKEEVKSRGLVKEEVKKLDALAATESMEIDSPIAARRPGNSN